MNVRNNSVAGLLLLPLPGDIESIKVLKRLSKVHAQLAELKGVCTSVPNQDILVSTLALQEAKDSSEIENIITTHDELYRSDNIKGQFVSLAAKEVHNYNRALKDGYQEVKKAGVLTNRTILTIQSTIKGNSEGWRKNPVVLKNDNTGQIVYEPPKRHDDIITLMTNLEQFINVNDLCDWDPLVKLAVIHHQFESIHPFSDGNGRTGRVINILYLVQQGLIDSPVLYLSRYINQHKAEYYRLLQNVRDNSDSKRWEEWILWILQGVEETARQTTQLVTEITALMQQTKHLIRSQAHKIYTQDLINHLFRHPYTKIDFLANELNVGRQTATKYLDILMELSILEKLKRGRENYYLNIKLCHLLYGAGERLKQSSSTAL